MDRISSGIRYDSVLWVYFHLGKEASVVVLSLQDVSMNQSTVGTSRYTELQAYGYERLHFLVIRVCDQQLPL